MAWGNTASPDGNQKQLERQSKYFKKEDVPETLAVQLPQHWRGLNKSA
ncbi:hypothetical protein [Akkermansia sp.]|nr:hypothetical protein [Akkermansia sp.]MCC8147719.1 hypothetical protein [Akkermansia sp.]